MAENKHQLLITIGAALSGGFNAAISGSTSKLKAVGSAIHDMEKQSLLGAASLDKLKTRYNSLLGSMNKQQMILQKRGFYRSQIMEMVALGASLAVPIRSAMKFEESLSNIAAVVNFPEPDGLKKLGATLTEISQRVPKTADELASIAAIGGRFQVSLADLPKFTEELAKTAVAWRMNSDEAAEKIGNLMKVFKIKATELEPVYDVINHLGNTTGATADNILKAINRSADGLANFKLRIPQVAALTSTIMSFGEGAEQAGSAISVMLQKLSMAPTLGAGAQKVLHQLGFGVNGLAELIQKEPQKVLDQFFDAVSKMDAKSRASGLNAIFGRGAAKTVGKLVDNIELYRHNLELINKSDKFKGSRNTDYDIVFRMAQSKLTLLTNNLGALCREIGAALIPTLNKVADGINGVLSPLIKWIRENPALTRTITHVVGGLISAKLATFALGYASTFLFGGLNRVIIAFKGLSFGISLLGGAIKGLIFGWFGRFASLAGGLGAILLGLGRTVNGRLVFSFQTLSTRLSQLTGTTGRKLIPLIESLRKNALALVRCLNSQLSPSTRKLLRDLGVFVTSTGGRLVNLFSKLGAEVLTVSTKLKGNFAPALRQAKTGIRNTAQSILPTIEAFGLLAGSLFVGGKLIKTGIVAAFSLLRLSCSGVLTVLGSLGKMFFYFVATAIPIAGQGIKILGQLFWFLTSEVIPKTIMAI